MRPTLADLEYELGGYIFLDKLNTGSLGRKDLKAQAMKLASKLDSFLFVTSFCR